MPVILSSRKDLFRNLIVFITFAALLSSSLPGSVWAAGMAANSELLNLAIQKDGRVAVAGETTPPAAEAHSAPAGYKSEPSLADDTDGDGMPDIIELQEGTEPSVKDNDIFINARWFVMQQYRDFFQREGDPGGVMYWTDQINFGTLTRAQVIDAFLNSAEFSDAHPIVRLYFAFFLRIPDYAGLLFWIDQYRDGLSLEAIAQAFAASPEFQQHYGNLTNQEFVALAYQNVLGRAADAQGLAFWTGHLDRGTLTRGQVMLAFSESAESLAVSFNKVFIVQIYVVMLMRTPDQQGFDFWVELLNECEDRLLLIDFFIRAAEYRGRFIL